MMTLKRAGLAAVIAGLEDTLNEWVAELSTSSPAPDDLWYQARLAFAQFLRPWIRLEESRLAAMSADPPAVC
jgi:hypothetical protein